MTTNPPTPYATDEDVALRASSDFLLLCPRDQKVACGSDGLLAPASPWSLFSPSIDFGVMITGEIWLILDSGEERALK